jgi:predicted Zn-dependent protease
MDNLLPVNICYDSGLDVVEKNWIKMGISELERISKRKFRNFENKIWSSWSYSSADWYVENAIKVGDQISLESLFELLHNEPWQKSSPHLDLLVTSKDLTAEGKDFVFGYADPEQNIALQSVFRFHQNWSCDLGKFEAVKRVTVHEVWHLLGAAPNVRSNTEENLGSHCINRNCAMRQGKSVEKWNELVVEEYNASVRWEIEHILCPQCIEDIRRVENPKFIIKNRS